MKTVLNHKNSLKRMRIYWLDVARVIAIVSISLNHAVNRSYDNYTDQMAEFLAIPLASTCFKVFVTVFSHLGVPLFLMITGTLLLRKRINGREDFRQYYRHNCLDLLITSEIWYFIMYWRLTLGQLFKSGNISLAALPGTIIGMIKTMLFIDQVTFDSTWYIPMILCVYLLIPVFAMVLQRCGLRVFLLPCIIVFLSTMLFPNINSILLLSGYKYQVEFALRSLNVFSGYYLYVFAGYWVSKKGLSRFNNTALFFLLGVSFLLCCFVQLYAYSRPLNYLVGYDFSLILPTSILLFEVIRRFARDGGAMKRGVTYLAKISFGIYFVHIIIMTVINKVPFIKSWPRPLYLIYLESASLFASVGLIWVLSHISVLKRRMFLIKD